MEKRRAIPDGCMTVGELAKKMNTTVRTLQYYDKEGVLSPSGLSEGGRRLYTDKDAVMLHQIQSLKYLGFSLDDIKNRLITLDTPEQVAEALAGQADAVREKIASLSQVLETIERLKEETLKMRTVNFRVYADIVYLLQAGEEKYWVVKSCTDKLWSHIRSNFDPDSAKVYMNKQKQVMNKAAKLKKAGIPPESEEGIKIGKEWWDLIMDFIGGDMSLLPEMVSFGKERDLWDEEWKEQWEPTEDYINAALQAYLQTLGSNPFE